MVIPQVFGRQPLYRVAARRCLRIVLCESSAVYGATPCTIDVILCAYWRSVKSIGGFAGAFAEAIETSLPSPGGSIIV